MKGMNNLLMFAIVGVGAYYFIVKKDVLGIMAAGGDGGTETGGATAPVLPTGSPNPAVPGASIYPPDQGGFYKGIEYPNLAAVFPTNPAIGYRPAAFRTAEELAVYKHIEQPPGPAVPDIAVGSILVAPLVIGGVTVPAGQMFMGKDANGNMIFEEPDIDPQLPPDAKPDTVVIINQTLPTVDIISYIDKDGRHREIKMKVTGVCNACIKSGNPVVCRKCGRGGIKRKIKKIKRKIKAKIRKIKRSHHAMALHIA